MNQNKEKREKKGKINQECTKKMQTYIGKALQDERKGENKQLTERKNGDTDNQKD